MQTRLAVAALFPASSPESEAFILREIAELERQGQPVLAVPLPLVSQAVAAASVRALIRTPGRYARLLGRLVVGLARHPAWLLRTIAELPMSAYLAERMSEAGIGHLHAYFAQSPAMVANVVSSLTGIGFSVTVDDGGTFSRPAFLRETLSRARFVRTTSRSGGASELMPLLDAVSEPVPPALSRQLEAFAWDGQGPRALGVRRVHERADSTVVEVLASDGRHGRDLVFKVQRAHPAGERARLEFDVLSLLSKGFAECPRYGVPFPLGLDENVAAVLMEPCRGRPLDALAREARVSRAPERRLALESALRRTGEWLRSFQAQTARPADGRSALDDLWASARRDVEACTGRALTRASAGRIAERLERLAARVAGEALRVVGRQGDFWPGNVYATEDRVEVIDFEGFGEGLPYEDAAYFLLQLELFFAYPVLRRQFAPLSRAFLEGYLEAEALDRPAWELCRLAKGLQMLSRDVAYGRGRGPRRWWRRHVLRAQVHRTGW